MGNQPIPDTQLGLSKTSAFETPTPTPFKLDGTGASGAAEAAYGMPPLIKHDISMYPPITVEQNMCLSCHNRTSGAAGAGSATSIPATHYASGGNLKMAQYGCLICHEPAANVPDLVINTGPKPAR
jgi:nitrate reductase cytochrome c-type subunit